MDGVVEYDKSNKLGFIIEPDSTSNETFIHITSERRCHPEPGRKYAIGFRRPDEIVNDIEPDFNAMLVSVQEYDNVDSLPVEAIASLTDTVSESEAMKKLSHLEDDDSTIYILTFIRTDKLKERLLNG